MYVKFLSDVGSENENSTVFLNVDNVSVATDGSVQMVHSGRVTNFIQSGTEAMYLVNDSGDTAERLM